MSEPQFDERLDAVLSMLESIASLDFTRKLKLSKRADKIDAVAAGLNMLSEELQSNVVKRSKLEEINANLERFASIAAHDMKSPLIIIFGLITLIENELGENANKQISQYLKLLKETNERTKRLINGILDYSRISFANMEMQELNLGKICREAAAQYSSKKQVVITVDEKLPIVNHYEIALTQIFSNLLSNAVKYNDKTTCKIEISCIEKLDYYELSVADNGPGIAEKKREKIFDLFENLRTEKDDSAGIGLATVKKMITETNGRIWVEPSKNQGAMFVFTINKDNITTANKK